MPTENGPMIHDIYQLKITLLGTRPPIWRRVLVPADLTLAQLDTVLQAAIGWENCHLHEFRIGRRRFGVPDPEDRLMGETGCIDERKVRLSDVLGKAGAKAEYTYDFGDSWEHSIVVEKVLRPEPGLVYPLCTGGKRQGPPEDCGGLGGYYNFLEAIQDPEHEEHADLLEWIGGSFDPEAFSVDHVNRKLAPLQRRRMKRSTPI
ncbi:MAG: plasmid pRiA4b ORF-3 family protein [Bryobacteraceae bacterium]|jgi:hypothetical protein